MSSDNNADTATSDFPPPTLKQLANQVASLLTSRKETVSVAETTSGGLVSAALLSVPGASAYYKGGLMLYTRESRIAYGGWTEETLKTYAGPTEEIVAGLAKHVRSTLDSTYTVGETGTAGPTGGTTKTRTPGYVALAVASVRGTVTREFATGSAQRDRNMVVFAEEALKLLLEVLQKDGDVAGL